jgi:hypothetical protein
VRSAGAGAELSEELVGEAELWHSRGGIGGRDRPDNCQNSVGKPDLDHCHGVSEAVGAAGTFTFTPPSRCGIGANKPVDHAAYLGESRAL